MPDIATPNPFAGQGPESHAATTGVRRCRTLEIIPTLNEEITGRKHTEGFKENMRFR
jgi:hypothetical protein